MIVFSSPSSSGTRGSQPIFSLARVISGRRWTGSSWGSGKKTIREAEPVIRITVLASSRIVNSRRRAEVHGTGEILLRVHHPDQAFDQIVYVTEGAGLFSLTVDGDLFPSEGLNDKVADDASIGDGHPWSIGIENSHDFHINMVLATVVHHQALGGPLSLVVAAPDPDRIDPSPVIFPLGVDLRITVHFRGGCLKDRGLHPFGESQGIDCAHDTGFDRLDGVVLIMNGRSRTGEIVYLIHFQIDGIDDVVTDAFKVLISQKMADIVLASGKEVVETQDLMSLEKQPLAEMRTDKTGAAGDKNPSS